MRKKILPSRFSTFVSSVIFRPLIFSATVNATADFPMPIVLCSQISQFFSFLFDNP
jgi:hypothetical protein